VLNRPPSISSLLLVYISRSRDANVGASTVTCDEQLNLQIALDCSENADVSAALLGRS